MVANVFEGTISGSQVIIFDSKSCSLVEVGMLRVRFTIHFFRKTYGDIGDLA